jgi:hypothetical protein
MTTIKLKNGSGAPTSGDLVQGEPALDLTNKRLYTEDSGGTVIEVGTNPGTDVTFADNRKAIFGAGSDLQIYHSSSTNDSIIDEAGTGNLNLQGTNVVIKTSGGSATQAEFFAGDANRFYYNNNLKLSTTSTGIDVTGTAVTDGLTVAGTAQFDDYGGTTGKGRIHFGNSGQQFIEGLDTGNGGSGAYLRFGYGSTEAMRIDSSGNLIMTAGGTIRAGGVNDLILDAGESGTPDVYLQSGGSTKVKIEGSNGNVGIGTSSPSRKFHVDASGVTALFGNTEANNSIELTRTTSSASYVSLAANSSTAGIVAGPTFTFSTANSGGGAVNERMRINSSGNVGIGESSPDAKLHIKDATDGGSSSVTSAIQFSRRNGGSNDAAIKMQHDGSDGVSNLQFHFGASEAMRIDSSGNLLVGKTTTTFGTAGIALRGTVADFTRDGGVPINVNRLTDDGNLIALHKSGVLVGVIGTEGSDLTIGTGDTGLQFRDASDAIRPFNISTNAARDANIDLGRSSERFRDLYLSGGVYLGGTGSANHLDDYEEGTFTVTFPSGVTSPTYVIQDGSYVKIGKLVTFQIRIELSAGTANSSHIKIGGLPFTSTSASSYGGAFFNYSQGFITDIGARTMHIGANGTLISFYKTDGNSLAGTEVDDITGTILINGQYEVA